MNKIITVYELLGLIKDGKAPHTILFKNEVWFWGYDTYTTFECLNKTPDSQISLFSKYRIDYCLNDIVEIIDNVENKPIIGKICRLNYQQIGTYYLDNNDTLGFIKALNDQLTKHGRKINEVIDYINIKEDK